MTAFSIVMTCVLAFELGWMVAWFMFDRYIHSPLQKEVTENNERMHKFLNENIERLKKVLEKLPGKREDGSMISPIQITPED